MSTSVWLNKHFGNQVPQLDKLANLKYVYLTDDTVQWGISADSWYEPMYNENGSYKNAKSYFQGKIFKFKYGKKYNRLTVIMGTEGGYKPIPPAIYMKCEYNE